MGTKAIRTKTTSKKNTKLQRKTSWPKYQKTTLPVSEIRKFLEPGPIVLVSSRYKEEIDIMTMGWHLVMEFSPSLIGCMISSANHSHELIKKSKELVINIPERHLANEIVGIGNTSGAEINKFEKFKLTPVAGEKVDAPLIKECYAHFECKVVNTQLLQKYNFFVVEVVHATAAKTPKYPRTIHYRGDGQFMISGDSLNLRSKFIPEML